jgi:rhomboid protease GluP
MTQSRLQQLTTALLLTDRVAHVVEQGPGAAVLQMTGATVILLQVEERTRFEATVRQLMAQLQPGQPVAYLAIDERQVGAAEVMDQLLPSGWAQLRAKHLAFSWVPGQGLKRVRGFRFVALAKAVAMVESGELNSTRDITLERASLVAEVGPFMAALSARKPVVTWTIGALSVGMFALQMGWGGGEPYVSAARMGGAIASRISAGDWWRLLAPMVLHGSILHLALNMLALFSFGGFLERFLGPWRYVTLYVASGLGGSIASSLRPTEVLSVGASGGIWGLMLAGAVLVTWPRGTLPELVSAPQRQRAWTPVLINGFYSLQPGIDLLAHFGGGLVGAVLVFTGVLTRGLPRVQEVASGTAKRESLGIRLLGSLCGLGLLVSVGAALVTGRAWELSGSPSLQQAPLSDGFGVQLPFLLTHQPADANSSEFVFGSFQTDPAVVVVTIRPDDLEVEDGFDPVSMLEGWLAESREPPFADFTYTTPLELRKQNGRPYLFSRQTAKDRTLDTHWLLDGKRVIQVQAVKPNNLPPAWVAALDSVPFTIGRALKASE